MDGLKITELLQLVREWCANLARAETHTSALEWFEVPILDLSEWAEVINRLEERAKNQK